MQSTGESVVPSRKPERDHGNATSMANDSMTEESLATHRMSLRVTYQETDGQRRVHHANYLNYFERGRVEMLRESGILYRDLEDAGTMLVVTEMRLAYHAAAEFDDELELQTDLIDVRPVRIRHSYRLFRDRELIVEGWSTIAAVDDGGKPCRLPKLLRDFRRRTQKR